MPPPLQEPITGHFVLNGGDGLTYRLADHLIRRYGGDVVVLLTKQELNEAVQDFHELPGAHLLVVDHVDEKALVQANVAAAAGLALTVQNDVTNIYLAMHARELAPQLRLVVRMYNTHLGQSIETLLGDCKVLSDAEIAAPELVAVALGEVAQNPVVVANKTLIVAERSKVPPHAIVCGLAENSAGGDPVVLPTDQTRADLVLAEADSVPLQELISTVSMGDRSKPGRWWGIRGAFTFVHALFTQALGIALLVLVGVIVAVGFLLWWQDPNIDPWRAFYLTAVNALGGMQQEEGFTRPDQVFQLIIGVAGLALIPLITALIVEGFVEARLAVRQARPLPQEGHVVVVGLGGLGTRVLRLLHDRGTPMVAIDINENARGVTLANELEIPVLIGDANRPAILRQAGVERCRALMAIAHTDATNLEVALHGRNLQPKLRVLLRLFDEDLAARARRILNLRLSNSVSNVAAPAFAEALMDRQVIGTIAVGRRVLLIAQVPVTQGSPLDGSTVDDADDPGMVRIIALTEPGAPHPIWNPPVQHRIGGSYVLTVVSTRSGLSRLMRLAGVERDAS